MRGGEAFKAVQEACWSLASKCGRQQASRRGYSQLLKLQVSAAYINVTNGKQKQGLCLCGSIVYKSTDYANAAITMLTTPSDDAICATRSCAHRGSQDENSTWTGGREEYFQS